MPESVLAVVPAARPARPPGTFVVLAVRAARITVRQVDAVVTGLVLPAVLVALFVWLFGGALRPDGRYVDDVVAGVLVLSAGFGAGTTAVAVCADLAGGAVDRLRTLDVGGAAFLGAHVAVAVGRNLVSSALAVGTALLLGFRPDAGPAGWLVATCVLVGYLAAISWVAACLGLLAGSAEAAGGASFALMFLAYPSSAVVPVATLPGWLQGFAAHQPVTPVVDAVRALLLGSPVSDVGVTVATALVWCAGVVLTTVLAAAALFRRRTR